MKKQGKMAIRRAYCHWRACTDEITRVFNKAGKQKIAKNRKKGYLSSGMIQKQGRHTLETPMAHENMPKPIVMIFAGPNG
jgi:hypothetical protein